MDLLKYLLFFILLLVFPFSLLFRFSIGDGIFINPLDVFVGLAVFFWLFLRFKKIKTITNSVIAKAIFAFSLICLISLICNSYRLENTQLLGSFLYLVRLVIYSLIFFVVFDLPKKVSSKLPLYMSISSLIILGLGYIQFFLYPNLRNLYYLGWDEHLYRLFSSFLDPNFAAAFFSLSFVLALGSLVVKKTNNKWLYILVASASFLAVFLTYSRSGLIMLFTSLIVFLVLLNKKKYIAFFLLAAAVLVLVSPKAFMTEGTNLLRTASNTSRIESSLKAVEIIKDNPVIGVGFNSYRYVQHDYGYLGPNDWQISNAAAGTDVSFLFVLATTGIVGFASFLFLIYQIFKKSLTTLKIPEKKVISIIFLSSLIGLLINSFFINSLFYNHFMLWIWMLFGVTQSES